MSLKISVVFLLLLSASSVMAEQQLSFNAPPESLKQWYKPDNKRQVWLHTMFQLARSMQAIREYADLQDSDRLKKWAEKFAEAYRSLPEMVPEWADEVDLDKLKQFEQAVADGDLATTTGLLNKLKTSCRSCHSDNKAISVVVRRSPDYKNIVIEDGKTGEKTAYDKSMAAMRSEINRIKIGIIDNRWPAAQSAGKKLQQQLTDQGKSCDQCHRDAYPKERILGKATREKLDELESMLAQRNKKRVGRLLGHIGYTVCARCHAVHRTLSDIRAELMP